MPTSAASGALRRAEPNGRCWDDCGGAPRPGSFFLPGHDKRAERYLTAIDGASSIADKLAARGFVPGEGSLRAATLANDPSYEECGRPAPDGALCRVIGQGASMRRHRADDSRHQVEQDAERGSGQEDELEEGKDV